MHIQSVIFLGCQGCVSVKSTAQQCISKSGYEAFHDIKLDDNRASGKSWLYRHRHLCDGATKFVHEQVWSMLVTSQLIYSLMYYLYRCQPLPRFPTVAEGLVKDWFLSRTPYLLSSKIVFPCGHYPCPTPFITHMKKKNSFGSCAGPFAKTFCAQRHKETSLRELPWAVSWSPRRFSPVGRSLHLPSTNLKKQNIHSYTPSMSESLWGKYSSLCKSLETSTGTAVSG